VAVGTQFLVLVTMLRAELGRADSIAVGVDDTARLKHHINRAYANRVERHNWPHLRRTFDPVPLNAGQRYYSFPSGLNFDRIEKAWTWWNATPVPIKKGITVDQYAVYDSTDDVRSSPVQRWDVRSIGSATQFEVWPLPADNYQRITFMGVRSVAKLVNDSDLCVLDDYLIVLDAAAAIEKDPQKRSVKLLEAKERYEIVSANAQSAEEPVSLNMGEPPADSLKGVQVSVR
jgi:hypothetical protein